MFDTNPNTYSTEGRIYQIEYAMKAMNHGVTTLAITTDDSVIVISEKKITNKLQINKSLTKHYKIDEHIAISYSGISADANVLIEKSREYMANFLFKYNQKSSTVGLLKKLCEQSLQFSEGDSSNRIFSRPFGASILVASYENKPILYLVDPSGSYNQFRAKSIGNASQLIDVELSAILKQNLSNDDTVVYLLRTLKETMKETISDQNVEIMIVNQSGIHFADNSQISEYIKSI